MDNLSATRRTLLGAFAAAPLIAVPALAVTSGSASFAATHARYIATRDALNTAPANPHLYDALERRYIDALRTMDEAIPTNWHEFVQKLEIVLDGGGEPGEDLVQQIIADAKRLAGSPAS